MTPTTLIPGARIEANLQDAPVGSGTRRFTVNEVGTRWVTLFYQPQAMAFRVLRAELESNRTLKVVDCNTRKLAPMIKATVEERSRLGLAVSVKGAETALGYLKDGTASKAKAASREATIAAAISVDWTRVRGNGLIRNIDGRTFIIRKAPEGGMIGLIDDNQVATGATEDAVKRALLKAHRASQQPAIATSGKAKREIVADLLTRKEGCTTADILSATGWPSVSVPQQARSSGLVLRTQKMPGQPTRYWASRPE